MEQALKKIEIAASARQCYDTICDFTTYPQWQKTIKQVTILDRENGRPTVVEYEIDLIKIVRYTLHYTYEESNPQKLKLAWTYVGGDLKNIEGSYTFEEVAPNKIIATYSLALELGFGVPGFLMNRMRDSAMQESIEALKKRAESKKANG